MLEAISLLAPGRGLRGAGLEELERAFPSEVRRAQGAVSHAALEPNNNWAIIAEVDGYKIATGIEAGFKKRIVKIDGEKQKGAAVLAEYASIIWLTPQMDGVFNNSTSERRQFFDRIIYNFDPEHASRVAVYENAMRERLRLIKENSRDAIWLKTLEKRMAEYGVAIAAARNEVIGYLQEELNSSRSSKFPVPRIEIRGKYEALLQAASALEVEQSFAEDLLANRSQDAYNGRTNAGVHKTDFHVLFAPKNMPASLSSTGEQKALLLSIIMGLARLMKSRKNKSPILLLDEVVAHLDEGRRAELFAEIQALNCQSFVTGTDQNIFENIAPNAQFFQVRNSALVAVK